MSRTELARPYARALYEVAAAAGAEEQVGRDLSLIRDVWIGDPHLTQPFLTHPLIRAEVKEAVLIQTLTRAAHPVTLNVVRLLLRRGRAALLPDLAGAFLAEDEERGRTVHVVARTAHRLSSEETARLQGQLAEALGRPVTIEEVGDPELLAGVELSVSGHRLDASLRGRLEALLVHLKG